MLFVPDGDLGYRHLPLLLERSKQDPVGLRASLVGNQVVGGLVVDGVDLRLVDELDHVDDLRAVGRHRLELFVGEHHVGALFDFVAPDDVLPGHLLAVRLRHPAVPDRRMVSPPQHLELGGPVLGSGVEGHRDRYQSERDRALPDAPHRHLRIGGDHHGTRADRDRGRPIRRRYTDPAAPVAQGIEHWSPEPGAQVRVLPGAPPAGALCPSLSSSMLSGPAGTHPVGSTPIPARCRAGDR